MNTSDLRAMYNQATRMRDEGYKWAVMFDGVEMLMAKSVDQISRMAHDFYPDKLIVYHAPIDIHITAVQQALKSSEFGVGVPIPVVLTINLFPSGTQLRIGTAMHKLFNGTLHIDMPDTPDAQGILFCHAMKRFWLSDCVGGKKYMRELYIEEGDLVEPIDGTLIIMNGGEW